MIHEQGRALEVLGVVSVAGKGAPVDGAEQITGLWVTDGRLRHDNRDRAVGVEITLRQGIPDFCLGRHADDETDHSGSDCPVFKGDRSVVIGPHTYIELLRRRVVGLSGV